MLDNTTSHHRKDIDGLRAVAVLSVFLYHLKVPFFTGGFVGVDVFFVISGFLITSIIKKALENDSFSFADFYKRRALRILPAFYFMVLSFSLVFSLVMLPADFTEFFHSALSSVLYYSNYYFWLETNSYFGLNSNQVPLLHTWSLSVEEQFYLIFPLLLYVSYRIKGLVGCFIVILGIFVCSLTLSELALSKGYTYFSLHTRAYELVLGGALAFISFHKINDNAKALFSTTGLIGIVSCVVLYDKQTPFPGLSALYVCLFTAMIIVGGAKQSIATALLQTRPFTFFGLLSYSLYLWHWPFIALANYTHLELTSSIQLVIFVTASAMAYVSWKYVENPVRRFRWPPKKVFVVLFAIPSLAVIGVVQIVDLNNGFPQRFDKAMQEKVSYIESTVPEQSFCLSLPTNKSPRYCDYGHPFSESNVLLIGDSHANSLIGFMHTLSDKSGLKFSAVTFPGAPYFPGVESVNYSKYRVRTNLLNSNAYFEEVLKSGTYDYVFIAGRFSQYIEGELEHGNKPLFVKYKEELAENSSDNANFIYQALRTAITKVLKSGSIPVVVFDVPEFDKDMSKCTIYLTPSECKMDRKDVASRQRSFANLVQKLQDEIPELQTLDISDFICDSDYCYPGASSHPYYFDSNHINQRFSRDIADKFESIQDALQTM